MKPREEADRLDNVADILPLSPVQTGILYECLAQDERGLANTALIRVDLDGPITPERFNDVLTEVVLAPDSQRAAFVHQGMSKPAQVIREHVNLAFRFEDLSDVSDPSERLDEIAQSMRRDKMDLAVAPLMRIALIRLSPKDHVLFWMYHHLIADGWSLNVLLNRILSRLNGSVASGAGPSFKDHLRLLQRRNRKDCKAFWAAELSGVETPTLLAAACEAPGLATESCSTTLDADIVQALADTARRFKTTIASLLSVGWALCLRRLTGRDDVTFATVVSGRDPRVPSIDQAVGSYAGILPCRLKIDPAVPVAELIEAAGKSAVRRAEFEAAPLSEALRAAGIDDLPFDSLLSILSFPSPPSAGPVRMKCMQVENYSSMPLAMVAEVHDRIVLTGTFDPKRLSAETVSGIVDMYARMLKVLASDPDCPVREMAGPDLPEVRLLPGVEKPHLLIHQMAKDRPEQPAIKFGKTTVSYRELDARAGALANALIGAGVGRGDLVPIDLERSERSVIAMLGVLYAGAAYVPVDPDFPKHRTKQILDQVAASVLVSDHASNAGDLRILAVPGNGAAFAPLEVSDEDPAYVIFTSGSSGVPKGVVVSHGNLAWSNSSRQGVYGAPPRSFLHLSSFAFDSSVVGLYWTLAFGGTLVIAPPRAEQDPAALLTVAAQLHVTHLLALPELWRALLSADDIPDCLETVIVAGEAVPDDLIREHFKYATEVRLFNEYGPTEGTVWCAAAELHGSMASAPIGRPPAGAALDVCDIDGKPLPQGIEGELILRGQGISQGYLNLPEATASRFAQDPQRRYCTGDLGKVGPDGNIHFLGRLDSQVKVRGHRVELGEIEAAARACGAIEAGASVSNGKIALAITGNAEAVDSELPQYLPAPLLPSAVVAVDELPKLPNGKLDRAAVAKLRSEHRANFEAPERYTEQRLCQHWEDALKIPVGRETHFFDAGGDSLKSIGLIAKAAKDGIPLKPGDIFTYPVLKDLSAVLEKRKTTEAS